jgi:hypothetical protein
MSQECHICGEPDADEILDPWGHSHGYQCDSCSESIYERQQSGECYRGGEAASHMAEQQAEIQRTLK